MDGSYPMDNEILSRTINWVNDNFTEVTEKQPISIHIDELLGTKVKGEEALDASLDAYRNIIAFLEKESVPVQPSLTIILHGDNKGMNFIPPKNKEEIISQLGLEPPSIYLLSWDSSKYLSVNEQYKKPLGFNLLHHKVEGVFTYYIEYRNQIGIENDWEFSRAIYLDYFPERFR